MSDINGTSGSDNLVGTSKSDDISGGSGNDTLSGLSGNDDISGGSGNDVLSGGSGNDDLSGGSGNDVLDGGSGNDELEGGSGNDILLGGTGNDELEGGSGDDILLGGSGSDELEGGSGDDILIGDAGADWLEGGSGLDVFGFLNASDSNVCAWDRIIDFRQGVDKIDLSALLGSENLAWGGKLAIENGAWYLNSGSSTFIYADVTGNGLADLKIELKNTCGLNLTADDFLGVGSSPVADDDAYSVDEDNDLLVNADLGVLDGDTAGQGDALSAVIVSGPAHGTLSLNADGSFTYTPDLDFYGSDSFTYKANDGSSDSNVATVALTVNPVNDAAVITGTDADSVLEASGVGNGTAGDATASGDLDATDVDSSADFTAQTNAATSFGHFSIDSSGAWSYTLDDDNGMVQALNTGGTLHDLITVATADGTTHQIDVTINGANDAALIAGTDADSVLEASGVGNGTAGDATASGDLDATDVDSSADFTAQTNAATSFGHFSIDSSGAWSYTLDDDNGMVQALNTGGTLHDLIMVATADGTMHQIDVTINGANDAALIAGADMGAVVEAGGVANAIPGTPTATGDLSATDVDNAADSFQAVAGAASDNGYGTFGVTDAGVWTYTLDNANVAVQSLNNGGSLSDTFTVQSEDGTMKLVTITIHGADDLLFDGDDNFVDFNAVVAGTYVAGTQYDALDGDDTVMLPNNASQAAAAGFDPAQTFHGGAGNDSISSVGNLDSSIDGGSGNDTLSGGGGNDTLVGGVGNDALDGGGGTDTVSYAGAGGFLGGVALDLFAGSAYDITNDDTDTLNNIENVIGSAFDDSLYGDELANVLDGGGGFDFLSGWWGNDTLHGGDGSDSLFGDLGNDVLFGDAGDDVLFGFDGNDMLDGGSGGDALFGEDGNDVLVGGLGDDFLDGGTGNDTLDGGEGDDSLFSWDGNDLFYYDALSDAGPAGDFINDFQKGADKLDLHDLLMDFAGYDGTNGGDYLELDTLSVPGSTVVRVDSDGDGGADPVTLATVSGVLLDASDFVL